MAAQQTGRLGQQSSHSAQEASSSGVPDSNTTRATGTHRGKRRHRTAGGRVITTDQPAAGAQQGRTAAARAKPAATAVPANAGARAAEQGNNAAARAKPAATAGHTSAGAQRPRQGKNAAARQPIQRGRSSFRFDCTPEADDDEERMQKAGETGLLALSNAIIDLKAPRPAQQCKSSSYVSLAADTTQVAWYNAWNQSGTTYQAIVKLQN